MALKSPQAELVETLVEFMRALDEPIHYKTLTTVIIDALLWVPYGKDPEQIVYSAMHQDVKKRGDYSAFKFMGKGVFVFSDVPGANIVEVPIIKNNTKPREERPVKFETPAEAEERTTAICEHKRCGNCVHIEFNGADKYRMLRGLCDRYEESGRCSVGKMSEACPSWKKRPIAQRREDQKSRENLRIFMSGLPYILPQRTMKR